MDQLPFEPRDPECVKTKSTTKVTYVFQNYIFKFSHHKYPDRISFGPLQWHLHPNRNIQTALFRLRSGHNKLNHCVAKWDSNVSPNCPHGCPEYENAHHVILHCHHFFEARSQLFSLLSANNIQPELPSILGLNGTIPKDIQEKIKSSLIAFIVNTELIRRI
jgi:hypothetical protein